LRAAPAIDSADALRTLLDAVFPGERIDLPAHADALLRLHGPLLDQRPATCGAYTLAYLLPARGFTSLAGEPLAAEDYMAHLAAVTIKGEEDPSTYRFFVRSSGDAAEQGTSPEGFARAVELATSGRLVTVPVPGRDATGRPQLNEQRWTALLDLIEPRLVRGDVDVVFNYESDQLLAARDARYNATTLGRPDATSLIPSDDWGVGHFAPAVALWARPSGGRWLVLLNSFKERGFAGVEPQPAELMRRAVVRSDGRGGGVFLLAPAEEGRGLVRSIAEIGLEVGTWSNGSLPPADWRWKRPA
jgi:hypothetical protein